MSRLRGCPRCGGPITRLSGLPWCAKCEEQVHGYVGHQEYSFTPELRVTKEVDRDTEPLTPLSEPLPSEEDE